MLLRSLFIFFFWLLSGIVNGECLPNVDMDNLQQATRWYVVDGDTLHFPDRTKLRLAMINAPELGRDGRPDQPYAQAAKLAAEVFLADDGLSWQAGKKAKDRYGRWLGSVFNQQGEWLGAYLVSQGLAYAISVGDNAAPDCLWRLDAHARRQQLGLWDSALGHELHSNKIRPNQAGFMLLQGNVEKIAESRDHWYVDLQGEVTLKINQAMWRDLGGVDPHAWLGQQVRVRGWLSWRKLSRKQRQKGFKPARMSLQHPHMLTVVN